MAAAADVDWSLVVHARRFFAAVLASIRRRDRAAGPGAARFKPAIVQPGLLAEIPLWLEERASEAGRQPPAAARREAEEVWHALEPLSMEQRRRRLGFSLRACRSWALAVKLCHESERAAAHSAKEAMELAELGLLIAGQTDGADLFRTALQGYCWLYIGNALRVDNHHDRADAAFARGADLLEAGADPEGLLPTWRRYDLEASLRREQHRFPDALTLLDRAFELCGEEPVARARILLKKEHVYDQSGNLLAAMTALDEAKPWVEASQDPYLRFAERFKRINHLVQLEHYAEAARLLPEARELISYQESKLSATRLDWLEAKTLAGLGQTQEAMERLEQVQGVFTAEVLPYDAALAGLDLAVLWLEAGRAQEVAQMAVGMEWIFRHQKIEREALAALKLFCDAARQEAATAALARQVSADIEKVRAGRPRSQEGS